MKIKELIEIIAPIAKSSPSGNVRQLISETCGENAAILLLAMFEGVRVRDEVSCTINGYGDVPLKAAGTLDILKLLEGLGVTLIETSGTRTVNYPFVRPRDRR